MNEDEEEGKKKKKKNQVNFTEKTWQPFTICEFQDMPMTAKYVTDENT